MNVKEKLQIAYESLVRLDNKTSHEHVMALNNALFVCVGGSHAYGMERPDSDVDLRGVFLGEPKHYLGLSKIEQVEISRHDGSGEKDTLYEFLKFMRLAMDNNPNVVEQLFLRPEHMLKVAPEFQPVLDNRHLFLSKKSKYSYSGYAFSQLKRISGHYEWLENPPTEPDTKDYSVLRYKHKVTGQIIPQCDYESKKKRIQTIANSANLQSDETRSSFFEDMNAWEEHYVVDKKAFDQAKKKWEQYNIWRDNRNETRAGLEASFGYDTKHAGHLMRLLIQSKQILENKTLDTYLTGNDLELVLSIKNGQYPYPDLIVMAEAMNKDLEKLYEDSDLRHSPAHEEINELCVSVLKNYIKRL